MSEGTNGRDLRALLQIPDAQSDDKTAADGEEIAARVMREIATYPHVGSRERLLVGVVVSMVEILVKEHASCPCAIAAHIGIHIQNAANSHRFPYPTSVMLGFGYHPEATKEPFTGDSEL